MSSRKEDDDSMVGGSQKMIKRADKFSTVHLVGFILCCVAGRNYIDWQPAMEQGFGQFMIAQMISAAAFIILFLCLAEIWSAIPFSGGSYGLARAVIGFYPGFLVGCAEALTFIIHSAVSALFLAISIKEVAHLPEDSVIGLVFASYVVAVALAIQPSTVVIRRSLVALAAISVGILLFWLFGSLQFTNVEANASLHRVAYQGAIKNWFAGGMHGFMFWLPYSALPYAGACSFVLMTSVTRQPKQTIPRAVMIGLAIIFSLNLFSIFVNAGLPNNLELDNPMLVGWRDMFKMTFDAAHHVADLLTFPAAIAQVYAYLLPCGALFQSLGRTNLLPTAMGLSKNKDTTPGILWSAGLAFIMCLWIHFQPVFDLNSVWMVLTVFAKVAVMGCYIKLKWFCPTLERGFTMPAGIAGASFVIVVLLLLFVAAAFVQVNFWPILSIACLWLVLTIYYYGFAAKTQTLCKEEDKVFLLLHVKNFNRNKKKGANKHKGNKAAIPNYKGVSHENSVHGSSHGSGASTSKVSPDNSVSMAPATSSGLLAQFRKINGFFTSNAVSPSEPSSNNSSSRSVSVRPAPSAAAAPSSTSMEVMATHAEEGKAGGDFEHSDDEEDEEAESVIIRGAELV